MVNRFRDSRKSFPQHDRMAGHPRASGTCGRAANQDGAPRGNADRTAFRSKRDDLISSSHFTTEKKLGGKCSRVLCAMPACAPRICERQDAKRAYFQSCPISRQWSDSGPVKSGRQTRLSGRYNCRVQSVELHYAKNICVPSCPIVTSNCKPGSGVNPISFKHSTKFRRWSCAGPDAAMRRWSCVGADAAIKSRLWVDRTSPFVQPENACWHFLSH